MGENKDFTNNVIFVVEIYIDKRLSGNQNVRQLQLGGYRHEDEKIYSIPIQISDIHLACARHELHPVRNLKESKTGSSLNILASYQGI